MAVRQRREVLPLSDNLKKAFLMLLLLIVKQLAFAQQLPQYTQYILNNYLLNPAVSGIENYTDIKAGNRQQWTGLEGAPVTSFFTVNLPLGKRFLQGDASAMSAGSSSNPMSRSYKQNYMAAEPHHGIGLAIVNDKAAQLSQTNVTLSYAYHLGITHKLNVALGVAAGVNSSNLNVSDITLGSSATDPAIANNNVKQLKPDLSIGLWAYSSSYYIGASVKQLLKQEYSYSSVSTSYQSESVPHLYLTGGVKLYLSESITAVPSVLIKKVSSVPLTFDATAKLAFKDKFWIGAGYRRKDAFSALAGFNISSLVSVGYAYDHTTSSLNSVSNGSHEIVLGLFLNNRYKVTCPMHTF